MRRLKRKPQLPGSTEEADHVSRLMPKPTRFEKTLALINPKWALERMRFRAFSSYLQNTTGYITPASSRRSMRGWRPPIRSADQDVLSTVDWSRAACRDLYMNSALGSGALKRVRTNVVGLGLKMQSRIDRSYLGLSDEQADQWETGTEREFSLWADSTDCDAEQYMNFTGLQGLALLSTLMSGDCFAVLPLIDSAPQRMPYRTRVKLIEADFCSNPGHVPDSFQWPGGIAGGVEVGEHGQPLAYYFLKRRKGDWFVGPEQFGEWERMEPFGRRSGRRQVLHLLDRDRPGQRRGMPLLASVVEPLKQIQRLTESELMASVISSFFTVFVKSTSGSSFGDMFTEDESVLDQTEENPAGGSDAAKRDDNLYELGSGIINQLEEDQDITIADPKRPNDNYNDFFTSIVKQISASIEIPYEELMMIFQSSYSASRAAILEAWKFYKARRDWLIRRFCQPVYEEWLAEAVSIGRVRAPGFFDDPLTRKAWCGTMWIGQGQGQIDPVKETKAAALRIRNNLSTYEDEYVNLTGRDWESTVTRLARQKRRLRDNGLGDSATDSDGDTDADSEAETERET